MTSIATGGNFGLVIVDMVFDLIVQFSYKLQMDFANNGIRMKICRPVMERNADSSRTETPYRIRTESAFFFICGQTVGLSQAKFLDVRVHGDIPKFARLSICLENGLKDGCVQSQQIKLTSKLLPIPGQLHYFHRGPEPVQDSSFPSRVLGQIKPLAQPEMEME